MSSFEPQAIQELSRQWNEIVTQLNEITKHDNSKIEFEVLEGLGSQFLNRSIVMFVRVVERGVMKENMVKLVVSKQGIFEVLATNELVIFLLARTQFHIQSWQTYQRIVVMRKQEEDLWGKLSAVYGNSQLQQQTATKREMEMKKWQVWGEWTVVEAGKGYRVVGEINGSSGIENIIYVYHGMKNVNRGLSGEENMVGMVLGKTMDSVGGVVGGWKNETGGNVTVMTVGKEDLLIEERQAKEILFVLLAVQTLQVNSSILTGLKQGFVERVRNDFVDRYRQTADRMQVIEEERWVRFVRQDSLFRYETMQTEDFMRRWLGKIQNRGRQRYVLIEVPRIRIDDSNIPKTITLTLNDNLADTKTYIQSNKQRKVSWSVPPNTVLLEYSLHTNCIKNYRLASTELKQRIHFNLVAHYTSYTRKFETSWLMFHTDNYLHEVVLQGEGVCLLEMAIVETHIEQLSSVYLSNMMQLFECVGSVPGCYGSMLSVEYTPERYELIERLLYGEGSKLSKKSFEKVYLRLVRFVQAEENASQNWRKVGWGGEHASAVDMELRFDKYSQKISEMFQQQSTVITYYSNAFPEQYAELGKPRVVLPVVIRKNIEDDLSEYRLNHVKEVESLLMKVIAFAEETQRIKLSAKYPLKYQSFLMPIIDRLRIIISHSQKKQALISPQTVVTIVGFLQSFYPYCTIDNFKEDLTLLRILVQEELPEFNYWLNRQNIGLENCIAPYLLTLFADGLSIELTYRIWDYLLLYSSGSSVQQRHARLTIAYTLLVYFETTECLPIIPINQFMECVLINQRKIVLQLAQAEKYKEMVDGYYGWERMKRKRIVELAGVGGQGYIARDRYLKRFILGEMGVKVPFEEEGKAPNIVGKEMVILHSIQELAYPLPRANYMGDNIVEILLMVQYVSILATINFSANEHMLKVYSKSKSEAVSMNIRCKHEFVNRCVGLAAFARPLTVAELQYVTFELVTVVAGKEMVELRGKLFLESFHKDKAYRTVVRLESVREDEVRQSNQGRQVIDSLKSISELGRTSFDERLSMDPQALRLTSQHLASEAKPLSNNGESIIHVTLCLKTTQAGPQGEPMATTTIDNIMEKILDYDIHNDNNETIKAHNALSSQFYGIKHALDEFSKDKYLRLKVAGIDLHEADWLLNSTVSIEEFKAIFYTIFYQLSESELRLDSLKYYELFSSSNNYQFVYLSKLLLTMVLMSNITTHKKLIYLFCLIVHYQNCYSKKLTCESYNSLLREIYADRMMVNACPYSKRYCGRVLSARYYQSEVKERIMVKDITEIVQDWVYLSMYRYGYNVLVLGDATSLQVLRGFLDVTTLKRIEEQPQCRFEVVYEYNNTRYIWCAVADSKTFVVIERGVKFLNSFSRYEAGRYMTSAEEVLMNCENMLPLQRCAGVEFGEFVEGMKKETIVRYLLERSVEESFGEDKKGLKEYLLKEGEERMKEDKQNKQNGVKGVKYNSWAIYRSDNCLEQWRRCRVLESGPIFTIVDYQNGKELGHDGMVSEIREVLTNEVIGMDEIGPFDDE